MESTIITFFSQAESNDHKDIERNPQQSVDMRSFAIAHDFTLLIPHGREIHPYTELEEAEKPEGDPFTSEEYGEEQTPTGQHHHGLQ